MTKKIRNYKVDTKTLIFIDSNIYLRFFDSNQPNYKQLLKILIQLKDRIFVTRQIINEVLRNKGQIFERTFVGYIKQVSDTFNNVQLPEHLDGEEDGKIREWNLRRSKLKIENEILVCDLKAIFKDTFQNIYLSKDEVSKGLDEIFKGNKIETQTEFSKAEKRKTIGNPPGKNNDSLGDQINWEQLLNSIANVDDLYIVSNDYDYFININDDIFLNPLLDYEIKALNNNIIVHCFNKLSDALQMLNKQDATKPLKIPTQSVIEKIKFEEVANDLEYTKESNYKGQVIYYNKHNHKLLDELNRINYMYTHAMLSSSELVKRLEDLGITQNMINNIIRQGRITSMDLDFFATFFPLK